MSCNYPFKILATAALAALATGCVTTEGNGAPLALLGAPCADPPVLKCPDSDCGAMVVEQGPVVEAESGRQYFIDYPCDLKQGEDVTVVLSLHGGGSYGNWQRHYFPILDHVDEYRLVVVTPNAPPRVWMPDADDAYLRRIMTSTFDQIGAENVKSFWLAGHSQGSMTSRRLVCSDYFADKVDGYLSLSGGRVGGSPSRGESFMPAPQRGAEATQPSGPPRRAFSVEMPALDCDFSHIYTTGEHEIGELPDTSEWAEQYGCDARGRPEEIVDTKAGYVYDTSRQDPPTKGWGRPAAPGTSMAYDYAGCEDGRVVADVVRLDKGHTEGLEPHVTEYIVRRMSEASGGKLASSAG